MVGINWNIMEDDGYRYKNLFDVKNSWNIPVFPSAVNVDFYMQKGMSIDFMASYNEYQLGKTINKDTTRSGKAFAFSGNFKYSFGFLMRQQIIDPFVFAGIGYTGREAVWPQNMLSGNIGAGVNIMIFGGIGVQWRTTGKIGLLPEIYTEEYDYLHHHFGVIYKFAERSNSRQRKFTKKKHQWGFKKPRYRKAKGM
ncbi:hypothetical protein CW751_01750 [Brumimicrobium salinarum]|uniref:Outer membrane protein beta-barrel domain-containing protein n=2 Tax=Brumimicrobium salinarum TaxID=2058658 RepID=A0A2I0R682_9FLAO|nr:hypothetical protein CW751_01750 [Brumimicrobium salinarum]